MGSRGPAKTPTRLKVLRGETRPSRINADEPKPTGAVRPPPGMAAASLRIWRRVIAAYGRTGVLTAADADILRSFCDAVVRYEEAEKLLSQTGPVVRGQRRGELVKNPLHQIVRDNAVLVRSLAREIGLSPAARTGLTANQAPTGDPFEAFLKGVG